MEFEVEEVPRLDIMSALKKSLQASSRKPMVKAPATAAKKKPQITLGETDARRRNERLVKFRVSLSVHSVVLCLCGCFCSEPQRHRDHRDDLVLMKDPRPKVISFPSPVPSKADYQRVKSSYSIKEIKQLFGLSEKTIRRWTEQGIIQASSPAPDFVYDFQALTQFRRVRELRAQGHSLRQIEAELQGQLNLFRVETPRLARSADAV